MNFKIGTIEDLLNISANDMRYIIAFNKYGAKQDATRAYANHIDGLDLPESVRYMVDITDFNALLEAFWPCITREDFINFYVENFAEIEIIEED